MDAQHWNGLLTTSRVLQFLVLLCMSPTMLHFFNGTHHEWKALSDPRGWIFVSYFLAILASLTLLKVNVKVFSVVGMLACFSLVFYVLKVSQLFSLESLLSMVAGIFLLVGFWRYQRSLSNQS